jgi:O-antigen ligase
MLSKIGMPLVYIFLAVMFIKPVYGIAFYLSFEELLNPQHYVPGYLELHMGSIFMGILLVAALLHRRDVPHQGLFFALFCFAFFGLLSTLINGISPDQKPFFSQVRMLRSVSIVVILTSYIRSRKEFFTVMYFMLFALFCNIVFQCMQCWFGYKTPSMDPEVWWGATRYSGFLYDTNAIGAYLLVFLLPPVYYFFQHAEKTFWRIIFAVGLAFSALGVFLTISRSAFVGLMIFGGMVFLKDLKKVSTLFIIVFLFVAIANLAGDKWTRDTVTKNSKEEMKLDTSSNVRFRYWVHAIKLTLKNPVFGVGPGRNKVAAREQLHAKKVNETHNTPLHALVEFGLAGFIPFMCIPIIAWRSLQRLIRSKAPFFSEYAFYYQAGLAAFLFCTLFFSSHLTPMAWAVLAIPIVLEKIYKLEQQAA